MARCRLIYTSVSTEDVMSNEALTELLEKSARNNLRKEITGLLLLSGNRFVQVLEGDSQVVNELYGKIFQDARHHQVELLSYELTETAYFSDWSMRLVDLYNLPMSSRRFLMEKYSHHDGEVEIPVNFQEVFSLLLDARVLCQKGS